MHLGIKSRVTMYKPHKEIKVHLALKNKLKYKNKTEDKYFDIYLGIAAY